MNLALRKAGRASGLWRSPENDSAIGELERSTSRDFDTNLAGKIALAPFRMLPSLVAATAAGGAAAAAAPVGAGAAVATGAALGVKSLFWALQGYGALHEGLGQIEGPGGEKVSPDVQQALATSFSLLGGAAMEFGLRPVSAVFGGSGEKAMQDAVKVAGEAAIQNPTLLRLFGNWSLAGSKAVASGAAAMGGQMALNQTAFEIAQTSLPSSRVDLIDSSARIAKAGAEGFVHALPDMLVLGFLGPTQALMRQRGEMLQAASAVETLRGLGEAARASKLRERFSAGFEDLVKRTAGSEPGALDTVYATVEGFDQAARKRSTDPREMAAAIMGDGGAAWDKAKATGQPFEIPVEKYLSKVAANPELEAQLLPDLRIDKEGRTLREALAQKAHDLELLRRIQSEPLPESDVNLQRIREDFTRKAIGAGRPEQEAKDNAELVARWYRYAELKDRPRAEARGEAPWTSWDFYQRMAPIEIAGFKQAGGVGGVDWKAPANADVLQRAVGGVAGAVRRVQDMMRQASGPVKAEVRTPGGVDLADFRLADHLERDVQVTTLTGREAIDNLEIEKGPDGLPTRSGLERWAKKTMREKPVVNAHTGLEIKIDAASVEHSLRFGRGPSRKLAAQMLPELPGLLERAALLLPPMKAHGGKEAASSGFLHFFAPVLLDGKEAYARLVVRRDLDGQDRAYHLVGARMLEVPGVIGGGSEVPPATVTRPPGTMKVRELASRVKPPAGLSFDLTPREQTAASKVEQAGGVVLGHDAEGVMLSIDKKAIETLKQSLLHGSRDAFDGPFDPERVKTFAYAWGHYFTKETGVAARYAGPKGHLYRVDAPDDHELLHWDAALKQQPEAVQRAIDDARSLPGGAEELGANATGRDLHDFLAGRLGSERSAAQWLDKRGVPGTLYRAKGADNYVVWNPDRVTTLGRFPSDGVAALGGIDGGLRQGDRGAVTFTPIGGEGVKADIRLLNADPSTLTHETSHVFGRLLEQLASREGATQDVKDDYAALLRAMGYATPEERTAAREERQALRLSLDGPIPGVDAEAKKARLKELDAKEERISYLWEQYLREGRAPDDASLIPIFGRFKGWLVQVYKSLKDLASTFSGAYGQELGQLHPETRALFDRILTADEAVKRAAAENSLNPLPGGDAASDKAFADARAEAEQSLLHALVEGDRKANSEFMQGERERLRTELAPQIDSDPVQVVIKALQDGGSGTLKGPEGHPLKLDRASMTRGFGAEMTRSLAREHPGIFGPGGLAGEANLTVDEAAEALGFENASDLVVKLAGMRNRDVRLEQAVQQRMEELYGKPLAGDPVRLAEKALESATTPKAVAAIIKEMSRLAADIGGEADVRSRGIHWEEMVPVAQAQVTQGRVSELSPAKYQNAAAAAGRRAFDAMQAATEAKGEKARKEAVRRAWEARDQQLWSLAMAEAAGKEKEALDKRLAQIEKTSGDSWRAELGKADPVYRDAHDTLLEAVGLGPPPQDPAAPRATLEQALAKMAADANVPDFDPQVVGGVIAAKTPWKELTVAQAWEVSAAVQNLRAIANGINEVVVQGRRRQRTEVIAEMADAASKLPAQPKFADDPLIANTVGRTLRLAGQHLDALLMDVATVCHILDGGNRDGIFHKVFIDDRLVAREKRMQLTRSFLETINKAYEKSGLDRKRLYERIDIGDDLPLTGNTTRFREAPQRTRANLLMMALNLGNDSNAERFLGGYSWDREQVMGVLRKHLNAKEWRWVQGIWDALEGKGGGPSLYEEMAKVHEEETGLRPEKILATPFEVTTPEGEVVKLDGGYFPARYDPRPGSEKRTGEKQVQDAVASFFGEGYQSGGLKPYSPHAKQRAKTFDDIVNLDWGIVPSHVSQVIQDIAYRRYAKQTAAIILDARFQNLLNERVGEQRAQFFGPWLKAVVNSTSDALPQDLRIFDRIWSGLRSRQAVATIGWSLPVALGDLSQPLTAVATGDISAGRLALVTAKLAVGYPSKRAFVLENSSEARLRSERLVHRFDQELSQMGGRGGLEHPILRAVHESAFVAMEMTDRLTVTPIWLTKYEDLQAAGHSHEESVRGADDVLRKLFPPEEMATKSRILRSRGIAPFLLFYGYANKIWNAERQSFATAAATFRSSEASFGDKAGAMARFVGTVVAVSAVNGAIGEYFSGRGREEDEPIDEWIERKTIASVFYPIPFVGAVGEVVASKVVGALNGKEPAPVKMSLRGAPAIAYMQENYDRYLKAVEAWNEGDPQAGELALQSAELMLGLGLGLPTHVPDKVGKAALHMLSGETTPRGPLDAAGNLVYGERKESNPLSDLQAIISP
jgi:hypothetical protein